MRDLDFEAAERFIELTESPPRSGEADLTSGLTILHEGEFVWLIKDEASLPQDEWPQLGWGEVLTLEIPGQVQLRNGWTLEANLVQQGIDLPQTATGGGRCESVIQVNADRLAGSLTVRSRLAGDRIAPLGLDGKTQKVSDVMINRKIPRRVRDRWPLVLSGEEIIWIPGHRVSEKARITAETRRRLELSLKRVGGE
jgi:tRNA(Ile)-lysidine synthase